MTRSLGADVRRTRRPGRPPPWYRRDVEGLRAVAVLFVLAHHAGQVLWPGGFVGVDVFFVISGFVVCCGRPTVVRP